MKVSIMITTHNRLPDLQRTLAVLAHLNPQPCEILITADGCTDGTDEFVQREYPGVKLIVNQVGQGSVASRDQMMRQAVGDLVVSLDDDSYPEQADCLGRIVDLFVERSMLAVAHFPQRSDEYPASLTKTDFGAPCLTRSFPNSGACFRRSIYLQLPGFEPRFFHSYEEPDYALQCTAAGFEVYFAPIVTVRHHYSWRGRNEIRTHQQHARNELWSLAIRCPLPFVMLVIPWKMFSQFRFAAQRGPTWFLREPIWWWRALTGLPSVCRGRRPVSWAGFRQWLRLKDKQWLEAIADNSRFWEAREGLRANR